MKQNDTMGGPMRADAGFNQYAENYDLVLDDALSTTGESKDYFSNGRVKWYAWCLRSLDTHAKRLLDYGCGLGSTAPLLLEALDATSLIGVDPSDRCIAEARKLHRSEKITFVCLAQYKAAGDVDSAYCNGVFHHIKPPERVPALRQIYESLRPGGTFSFWENNPWNFGTRYVMSRCAFDEDAIKISPLEACRLIRAAGFDVLRVDYRFFFPHVLRFLRGLEASLRKVPLGGQYQVLCRKPGSSANPDRDGFQQHGVLSDDDAFGTLQDNGVSPELSVVMPCLNEAETLCACITQVCTALRDHQIRGEIIVADNGSSDGSPEIAFRMRARVVNVDARGYGNALIDGIDAARGKYVVVGDADCSYDFGDIPRLLEKLREGYDLVMGNRFQGGIKPGAMPWLHKYLGNPVLTFIGRLFFNSPCKDFHCGLRGFTKSAYTRMELQSTGMEFASEMVVKATLLKMRIAEVPTTLWPDGRSRPPHLRSWRDGWRHLRFLLLYSPRWLFLYPGLALLLAGVLLGLYLLTGPKTFAGITFDVHTLLYAAMAVLLGFQATAFAVFTKIFGISEGFLPEDPWLNRLFRYVTLETGLFVGTILMVIGASGSVWAISLWGHKHFGPLRPDQTLRIVIPGVLCFTLGFQVTLSSLFLSVLGLKRNRRTKKEEAGRSADRHAA